MTKIKKATQKEMIAAFHSGDFSKVDRIDDIARKEAANIFLAVASGDVSLVWYDMPPVRCQSGAVSVMRYALHRSTKNPGFLQLSCMEIKDGRMIPPSARQYNTLDNSGFREFFRDLPSVTNINYLEQ